MRDDIDPTDDGWFDADLGGAVRDARRAQATRFVLVAAIIAVAAVGVVGGAFADRSAAPPLDARARAAVEEARGATASDLLRDGPLLAALERLRDARLDARPRGGSDAPADPHESSADQAREVAAEGADGSDEDGGDERGVGERAGDDTAAAPIPPAPSPTDPPKGAAPTTATAPGRGPSTGGRGPAARQATTSSARGDGDDARPPRGDPPPQRSETQAPNDAPGADSPTATAADDPPAEPTDEAARERTLADAKRALANGQWRDAEASYAAALAVERDANALAGRGHARYELKQTAAARRDLEAALELSPSHPRALMILGSIAQEGGDRAGACRYYRRFLDYHPRGRYADQVRAIIEGLGGCT